MLNVGDTVLVLPMSEIDCSFPAVDEVIDGGGCFGIDDYEIDGYALLGPVIVSDVKRNYAFNSGTVADIYHIRSLDGKDLKYWWLEGMIVRADDDFDPSTAGDEDGLIGFLLGTAPPKDK